MMFMRLIDYIHQASSTLYEDHLKNNATLRLTNAYNVTEESRIPIAKD